jgi:hypothetical protein
MKTKLVKSIMSSLLFACALVSLVAAMALGTSGVARADSPVTGCSAQTLRGLYVFSTHGFNIVDGAAVPLALLEGIQFNGDGTMVAPFATLSFNGQILRFTDVAGSYTVAADCTGTYTFPGIATADIFVDPSARQLWLIQTGPEGVSPVFEGMATRVPGRLLPAPRP